MREEIGRLIQLQNLDQTIKKLNATKKELTAEAVEADRKSGADKRNAADRAEESKSFRAAMHKREAELKAIEGKIDRLQTQLNIIKTNKEYAALQHEIVGLKADSSRLEDEILRMIERVEADEAELKRLAAESDKAAQAAKGRNQAIETALADADARIERLKKERAELAAGIPAEYLAPYNRLLRKGDGRAMAACRSFVCEGCRMSLTANTVNLLMAGNRLVYCHSCGRILYLADDEDVHGGIGAGRT